MEKKNNSKVKGLSKTQSVILAVVITVLIVVLVPLGIYSGINSESPAKAIKDVFTPDSQQIIGKWQDNEAILGYEFYEDGTYDYHVSSKATITKDYKIKGNKLTLIEYNTNASVVYKISINNDVLKMTLLEYNGKEATKDEQETATYNKVNNFNLKTPLDALAEFAKEAKEENPDSSQKTTTEKSDAN